MTSIKFSFKHSLLSKKETVKNFHLCNVLNLITFFSLFTTINARPLAYLDSDAICNDVTENYGYRSCDRWEGLLSMPYGTQIFIPKPVESLEEFDEAFDDRNDVFNGQLIFGGDDSAIQGPDRRNNHDTEDPGDATLQVGVMKNITDKNQPILKASAPLPPSSPPPPTTTITTMTTTKTTITTTTTTKKPNEFIYKRVYIDENGKEQIDAETTTISNITNSMTMVDPGNEETTLEPRKSNEPEKPAEKDGMALKLSVPLVRKSTTTTATTSTTTATTVTPKGITRKKLKKSFLSNENLSFSTEDTIIPTENRSDASPVRTTFQLSTETTTRLSVKMTREPTTSTKRTITTRTPTTNIPTTSKTISLDDQFQYLGTTMSTTSSTRQTMTVAIRKSITTDRKTTPLDENLRFNNLNTSPSKNTTEATQIPNTFSIKSTTNIPTTISTTPSTTRTKTFPTTKITAQVTILDRKTTPFNDRLQYLSLSTTRPTKRIIQSEEIDGTKYRFLVKQGRKVYLDNENQETDNIDYIPPEKYDENEIQETTDGIGRKFRFIIKKGTRIYVDEDGYEVNADKLANLDEEEIYGRKYRVVKRKNRKIYIDEYGNVFTFEEPILHRKNEIVEEIDEKGRKYRFAFNSKRKVFVDKDGYEINPNRYPEEFEEKYNRRRRVITIKSRKYYIDENGRVFEYNDSINHGDNEIKEEVISGERKIRYIIRRGKRIFVDENGDEIYAERFDQIDEVVRGRRVRRIRVKNITYYIQDGIIFTFLEEKERKEKNKSKDDEDDDKDDDYKDLDGKKRIFS